MLNSLFLVIEEEHMLFLHSPYLGLGTSQPINPVMVSLVNSKNADP